MLTAQGALLRARRTAPTVITTERRGFRDDPTMSLGDKYIESAVAGASARLSEPVVCTLFVQRSGAMAAGLAGAGTSESFRTPGDKIRREGGKDTKLPQSFLLAATSTRVHVFAFKMSWGKTKLKDELGSFPRAGLELQTNKEPASQFLVRSTDPPQEMCFEAMPWGEKSKAVIARMTEVLADPTVT
jgi:hypothetical protein